MKEFITIYVISFLFVQSHAQHHVNIEGEIRGIGNSKVYLGNKPNGITNHGTKGGRCIGSVGEWEGSCDVTVDCEAYCRSGKCECF